MSTKNCESGTNLEKTHDLIDEIRAGKYDHMFDDLEDVILDKEIFPMTPKKKKINKDLGEARLIYEATELRIIINTKGKLTWEKANSFDGLGHKRWQSLVSPPQFPDSYDVKLWKEIGELADAMLKDSVKYELGKK